MFAATEHFGALPGFGVEAAQTAIIDYIDRDMTNVPFAIIDGVIRCSSKSRKGDSLINLLAEQLCATDSSPLCWHRFVRFHLSPKSARTNHARRFQRNFRRARGCLSALAAYCPGLAPPVFAP